MITVRGALGAAVLAALVASPSCKTTQPAQSGKQNVSISFSSRALLDIYFCWDATGANAPASGVYCEQEFDGNGFPLLQQRVLPWLYDLEISVIQAGKTTEKVIASSVTGTGDVPPEFPVFGNLTDYDTVEGVGPAQPTKPTPGVVYSNGREVSQGHRTFGQFAGFNYPEPNVLNKTSPYTFQLDKGDTVIIRARKILKADNPTPNALNKEQDAELTINGALSANGVSTNPLGTTTSPTVDGAGVTFSFTIR